MVGGITDGDPYTATLGSMIIYDPVADAWQPGASVGKNRSLALTVAPDNAIYAFGGEGGEGASNSRYDPALNQWDRLSTYFTDSYRSGVGAAYSRGRMFIVGGYESFYQLTTQNVESLRLFDDVCLSSLTADRAVAAVGERVRYTIEVHSGTGRCWTRRMRSSAGGCAVRGLHRPRAARLHNRAESNRVGTAADQFLAADSDCV